MRTADGYIISKCLDGDSAAFGLLVDKYKAGIYALAYSKLRNFHDAEDLAQEVFIKAYKKLRTLKQYDSFHAWLYSITVNLCKNWIRARSRRPDREFIEDQAPDALETPSMDAYREGLVHETVREALDSLPDTYCQVLTLYYLGGMNSREIAEFLGTTPTAVRHRLTRARSQLKDEMLAKMSKSLKRQKLHASFTFCIVEAARRAKFHPMPRAASLPWGLSFAAGIIIAILCISPHLSLLGPSSVSMGSPLPAEAKVLEIGQITVDILEVSRIPVLASKKLDEADMPTASLPTSPSPEAAEDAKGTVNHTAEQQGHYMMGCYAEMPGKGEFARGWFELGASDSGFALGSDNTTGFPTTRQEAPAPWYMLFRYVTHPLRRVRLSTRVGDKWSAGHGWRLKADTVVESNKDAVTVPAGTFRDCLKLKTVIFDGEIQPQGKRDFVNGTRYMWFALGVGLVKLEYYHDDNTTTNIELVSYSVSEKDYEWYFPLDLGNRWTYDWTNRYWHYKVRETCAIISANPSTIKVCKYLRRNKEYSYSREEIKEECNLSDEELDAAVELLVEWHFAEWKNGGLTGRMQDWSTSVARRFAR